MKKWKISRALSSTFFKIDEQRMHIFKMRSNNSSLCETVDALWWCEQETSLIVLMVIAITFCAIGSFGNLITILAIIFSNLRSNVNCILIGSLSMGGFLYCSVILPLQAVIYFEVQDITSEIFCRVMAGMRYSLVGTILMNLSVIAFYRFLNIVHINLYHKLSTTRSLVIAIALSWIFPLFFTLPPTLSIWGSFSFNKKVLACTFFDNGEASHSNRYVTVTAGFIVPCFFITFCYARIGCVAYGSSKRIGQWSTNATQTKALRLSAMMLCIFAIFFVGTFPYFTVNVYDRNFEQPIHHLWTTVLGWLSYCLNPVVYTVMDRNFRTAYRRFLMGDCERSPLHRHGSFIPPPTPV